MPRRKKDTMTADELREEMHALDLTQTAFSQQMGISMSQLNRMVMGKQSVTKNVKAMLALIREVRELREGFEAVVKVRAATPAAPPLRKRG